MFDIYETPKAKAQLEALRRDKSLKKRLKAVRKAIALLAQNPKHPSLATHEYHGETCPHGKQTWEAYAENRTPAAYRIFFCYGSPHENTIWILSIRSHP